MREMPEDRSAVFRVKALKQSGNQLVNHDKTQNWTK
jgi:hypothetical protein